MVLLAIGALRRASSPATMRPPPCRRPLPPPDGAGASRGGAACSRARPALAACCSGWLLLLLARHRHPLARSPAATVAAVRRRAARRCRVAPAVRTGASACCRLVGSVVAVLFLLRAARMGQWGGLMLNLFLAFPASSLCFPLGVAARPRPAVEAAAHPSGCRSATSSCSAACRCSCCCCCRTSPSGSSVPADAPRRASSSAPIVAFAAVHRGVHRRDRARRLQSLPTRPDRGRPGARARSPCARPG